MPILPTNPAEITIQNIVDLQYKVSQYYEALMNYDAYYKYNRNNWKEPKHATRYFFAFVYSGKEKWKFLESELFECEDSKSLEVGLEYLKKLAFFHYFSVPNNKPFEVWLKSITQPVFEVLTQKQE